jgi:hypothetical protein
MSRLRTLKVFLEVGNNRGPRIMFDVEGEQWDIDVNDIAEALVHTLAVKK